MSFYFRVYDLTREIREKKILQKFLLIQYHIQLKSAIRPFKGKKEGCKH